MIQFGVEKETIPNIREVFARYPQVEKAALYGSRAMGTYKNGSDIGLTLYGGEEMILNLLNKIRHDLNEFLLPYKIDLSIINDVSVPDVAEHIRRAGEVFYKKNPTHTAKHCG